MKEEDISTLMRVTKGGIFEVTGHKIMYKDVEYYKEANNSLIRKVVRPRNRRMYLVDIPVDLNEEILREFERVA